MQRSPALRHLSREHHAALRLAVLCERAALSGEQAELRRAFHHALQSYANELEPHFLYEETELLPLLSESPARHLAERTLEEHRMLRSLLGRLRQHDAIALKNFAVRLKAHVRFEERELFPALESRPSHRP